jgi:hypothetical protein
MLINLILTGKIIKKILKLAVLLFVILITAVFTLYSILQTPSFQVLAGRLAAGFLSRHFNSEIYLDRLRITESLDIQLQGLKVNDYRNKEMIRVDDMRVKIDNFSLKGHMLRFDKVSLDSGGFFLETYPGDSLSNLDVFLSGFRPDTLFINDTVPSKPWNIYCRELIADNFSFGLRNDPVDSLPAGIDFNDLLLSGIYIDLKEISVLGDSITAFVEHISCREKSGLELLNFSGDAKVSSSGIRLRGGQLSTGQTSLDLDLDFLYDEYGKLSDFLDSVIIKANIRSSLITLSDIGYFAPELMVMDDPVLFSGQVEGPVSNFIATGLNIKTGDFTEFNGTIRITGLPNIDSTFFDLNIYSFITTPEDLAGFNLPLDPPNLVLPAQVSKIGFTSVSGIFKGFLNDFNTSLTIKSDAGNLQVKGALFDNAAEGVKVFSGEIYGDMVNSGLILETGDLGTLNFEFEFDGKGHSVDDLDMSVNGWIQDLEFRKYRYEKIILGGKVLGKSFDGRLVVLDKMLNFDFNGLIDFNAASPSFKFVVDIDKARLFELNLSDRSEDANLTGHIEGDFMGSNADSVYGKLLVENLRYHENEKDYDLHHFEINRKSIKGQPDSTRLRSDYIDGDIEGKFIIKDLIEQFAGFIIGNDIDTVIWQKMVDNPQYVSFDFRLKNLTPLTDLFLPGINISRGARIHGKFDSGNHLLELKGNSDTIEVNGILVTDVGFNGLTSLNKFNFQLGIKRIAYGETTQDQYISLNNLDAQIMTGDSSLNFAIQWDNDSVVKTNRGSLEGFVNYESLENFEAGLTNAEADFNGELWRIEKGNLFKYDSTNIKISNFKIFKGDESFLVDGNLSESPNDTLNLYFKDWELKNFNPLLENLSLNLVGVINGRFGIFRNEDVSNLFAGIHIDDFGLNDVFFGDADFKTRWLESDKALAIDLNILSKGTMEEPYKILGVNGMYYPFDNNRNFDFDISAQNLDISVLEPLLSSFSSHFAGLATGKLTLDGTNNKPLLLGKLKLQRAEMQVDYLNVIYSFSNEVVFKEDIIQFNELKLYDPRSNSAVLKGGIKHKYFNDMSLDLTIEPVDFMAMNLDRYQNEVFYGTAYATGTVKLTGPFENLAIIVDVKTDKGTKVTIPITYSVDVSENNFIVFSSTIDSLNMQDKISAEYVGMSLDIAANITNDADIEIFLPGNIGLIKARGDGKLRLGVDPNFYLTLNGSYVIRSGLFVFSLEQLVSRRFDIMEGSKISWTGDLYNAEVNIVARYRLRTDLSGLGITLIDPEAASQKVIVFTDIRMKGNLFNPELSFGITFPNMQEQTKQAVYAVLDTNDLGLMNQQAISLLILGSFSSTGSGGTSPVNPAAIVSNTLSNMLSQISNDVNIGINYMPGDQVTSEQLEVALSTQLLDDRLVIDGNIDVMGSNASSQQTSSIVGDINVEYKLTPDGRFRVKAFNRSNDLSLFNDYAPYTQGVGIFYRKDFNNFYELFHKAGKEPKKKE